MKHDLRICKRFARLGTMFEVKWLAILGLVACFLGTGFLSIDKVGPERVSRWVTTCNHFLTSSRIPLLLATSALAGVVVVLLIHAERSRLSVFITCVVSEWRVVAVVGFALLAEVFYLLVLGKVGLKRLISGGKSERLQIFFVVLIFLFLAGPVVYALGSGSAEFSVISLGISISVGSGFGTVLLASGLVAGMLGGIRFLDRPGATISRFAVIGFGLLALGFVLQLAYISLI